MSKIFGHPLNEESLKTYIVFASQQCTLSEIHFRAAPSKILVREKQCRHNSETESYTQVIQTCNAEIYEIINPEFEPKDHDKSIDLQNMFDIIIHFEKGD